MGIQQLGLLPCLALSKQDNGSSHISVLFKEWQLCLLLQLPVPATAENLAATAALRT